uniref:FkbM family methyltransferase n=1 Tax=Methylobacterium sp. B34 TaxID=95563 RepID=UPI0016512B20|nr:FkbM family methyltransferase [Methylobacterium sp. B34]
MRHYVVDFTSPAIRIAGKYSLTRNILNMAYNCFSENFRHRFSVQYSKIYRTNKTCGQDGSWDSYFLGKKAKIPIRGDRMWLDWDVAICLLGHDLEVKQTYKNVISSLFTPDIFLDVGANYGTHSLLLALHGVDVVAFEPNKYCVEYGQAIMKANDCDIAWENVAVGENFGEIALHYPEMDTWLGTVANKDALRKSSSPIKTDIVRLVPLDSYVDTLKSKNIIIKIDAEGFETEVIRGGSNLLKASTAIVLFESTEGSDRIATFNALNNIGYKIYTLPWTPKKPVRSLDFNEFVSKNQSNFAAVPSYLVDSDSIK